MPRIDAARVKRMLAIALCGVLPAGIASPAEYGRAEHGRLAPTLVSMVEQVRDGRIVLRNTATVMQGVPDRPLGDRPGALNRS